jgi:Domain of unknown function (DUF5615)
MDVHIRREVTDGLRLRQVDALTAQEDASGRLTDPQLLDRAAALDRVLFSQDKDLLREAARRQRAGEQFAGVIYGGQQRVKIGRYVDDLEIIAKVADPGDLVNQVWFLPL